jgi:hypothetical protein
MGQRSSTETVVAIVQAFLPQRSWKQAELARSVGIGVAALRKRLDELVAEGFPFTREEDPPDVWWSAPPSWFPGGVVFTSDDALELLRQLGRLPKSKKRDGFIKRILSAAPRRAAPPGDPSSPLVTPGVISESEELYLPVVEDAASSRVALNFKYLNAEGSPPAWRHASVQRILVGPPARFVAVCHRSNGLKWFRVDGVLGGRLDGGERYRPVDPARVDTMVAESLDGFHQGGEAVYCSFTVRDSEARWVARNLLPSMTFEPAPGGSG